MAYYLAWGLILAVVFFSSEGGKDMYFSRRLGYDSDKEELSVIDYVSFYGVKSDGIKYYVDDILEHEGFKPTTRRREQESDA